MSTSVEHQKPLRSSEANMVDCGNDNGEENEPLISSALSHHSTSTRNSALGPGNNNNHLMAPNDNANDDHSGTPNSGNLNNTTTITFNEAAMRGIYSDAAIPNRAGCTLEFNDLSIVHTPTLTEALYTWWHSSWWWNKLWSLDTNSMDYGGGVSSSSTSSTSVFVRHNNNAYNNNKKNLCSGCSLEPFIVVRSAIGVFGPSQIHAITTPSLASAEAIVQIILGEQKPTEGNITVNGEPMPAYFRLHVGIVDQRASWSFDNLTVRENLMFAAKMRRPTENADIFEERSSYLSRLFHLDVAAKAEKLSVMMRLRLDIAMELMVDPSILIVIHPFETLDRHSHSQLSNTLIVAASVLKKTVIVTMSSLPLTLVPALDTVLLLGADDGHCLYSGSRSGLFQYFTQLQLPPLISHRALRNLSYSNRNNNNNNNTNQNGSSKSNNINATPNAETTSLLQQQQQRQQQQQQQNVVSNGSGGSSGNKNNYGGATTFLNDNNNNNNYNQNQSARNISTNDLSVFDENTADAVMDQVTAWSSSPVELSRYASKFYDSSDRRKLVEEITRIRRRGDVTARYSMSRMGSARFAANGGHNKTNTPTVMTPPSAGNETATPTPSNQQQPGTHQLPSTITSSQSKSGEKTDNISPSGTEHELATDNGQLTNNTNVTNAGGASLTPKNDEQQGPPRVNYHQQHNNNNPHSLLSNANHFGSFLASSGNLSPNNNTFMMSSPNDQLGKPVHPRNAFIAWLYALLYFVFTSLKSTLSHLETYVYWMCLVLVLVFCAYLLGKQHGDYSATQNIEGIFFLIFTVTTMLNMAAVEEIYHNKRRFYMMRRGGVLGPLRYFTVKLSQLILSRALLASMVAAACRVMIPDVNIRVFVSAVGVLSFTHYSLLFMFCMISPESWLATSALVIYTGYSLLFAGFFLNIETQGVTVFSQGSIVRYAYGISVKTFVEDNHPAGGENQLADLGFSNDSMDNLLLILLTTGFVAWVIVFIKLKWLS